MKVSEQLRFPPCMCWHLILFFCAHEKQAETAHSRSMKYPSQGKSLSVNLFPDIHHKVQTIKRGLKTWICKLLLCFPPLCSSIGRTARSHGGSLWQCSVTACLLWECGGGGEETGLDTESM